jgi:hypothetical protein
LEAGANPALYSVTSGSVNLVRGGRQSKKARSGVANVDPMNSYNAATTKSQDEYIQTTDIRSFSFPYLALLSQIRLEGSCGREIAPGSLFWDTFSCVPIPLHFASFVF